MHMGTGTTAADADKADLSLCRDLLPDRDEIALKMGVEGVDSKAVVEFDHLAVLA